MEQEKFNRVGYLQDCCNRYGDFKVASTWKNNQGELCWSKHRSVLACWHTDEGLRFLERVNHRSCFEAEIILDIENDDLNNLKKIVSDLLTYTNRFKIFSTGSRGFHIHCIFPELASKSKDYRMKMRDVLIDKYGTDKGKRKESDMIAIEYVPHWKSGKIKEEISIDKIRG